MTHTPTDVTTDPVADSSTDPSTDVLDEEWLAAPTRRSRLRIVLTVLLAASLVFLAGVEVQRNFGAASSTASAATAGFPDLAGAGGELPPGFPGSGAAGETQPETTDDGASGDETAVIGTLQSVKGDVWTIKDLGGQVHKVTVSETIRVVRESDVDPADVETGATVDIAGTTDDAGDVTATSITIR